MRWKRFAPPLPAIYPVKKATRSPFSRVRSFAAAALRPSADEVEAYACVISEREGRRLDDCRLEAELQLWVWHAEHAQTAHPFRRRAFATADVA